MQISLSGLTIRIGTDDRIRVTVTDANGVSVDLTNATISGSVKRFRSDDTAVTALVVDDSQSDKAQGQLALGFQSDLPAPGVYFVDVRIALNDPNLGSIDNVVGEALIEAYYPVTR